MKRVLEVPVNKIRPDPKQPRKHFDKKEIKEMAKSIKATGVVVPIEIDKNYRIVHGERRWRAAKLAGLKTIRSIVNEDDMSELERIARQFAENSHRKDIGSMETVRTIVYLSKFAPKGRLTDTGAKWVADKLGLGRETTSYYLRLLKESKKVHKFIEKNPDSLWWFYKTIALKEPLKTKVQNKIIDGILNSRTEIDEFTSEIKKHPDKAEQMLSLYTKENQQLALTLPKICPKPITLPQFVLKLERQILTFEEYLEAIEEVSSSLPKQSRDKIAFSLLEVNKKLKKLFTKS